MLPYLGIGEGVVTYVSKGVLGGVASGVLGGQAKRSATTTYRIARDKGQRNLSQQILWCLLGLCSYYQMSSFGLIRNQTSNSMQPYHWCCCERAHRDCASVILSASAIHQNLRSYLSCALG